MFGIDASSDPTKFQGDWPSGSRLIGAWSSAFAFNVFVCQVEPLVRSDFFGWTLILLISDVPNRLNMSISRFPAIFKKIGEGHIFTIYPTKFQGDWPSGSRLIGAWSSAFAFNVFVCQVEPLVRSVPIDVQGCQVTGKA